MSSIHSCQTRIANFCRFNGIKNLKHKDFTVRRHHRKKFTKDRLKLVRILTFLDIDELIGNFSTATHRFNDVDTNFDPISK